jgi:inhibitor of cysteine peptidase
MSMKLTNLWYVLVAVLIVTSVVYVVTPESVVPNSNSFSNGEELQHFSSGDELLNALENARDRGSGGIFQKMAGFGQIGAPMLEMATTSIQESSAAVDSVADFSNTNVQVQGVDEADIIKTDGEYLYMIAGGKVVVAKAHPDARILDTVKVMNPTELFIDKDRLMVVSSSHQGSEIITFDTSDKSNLREIDSVEIDGNYITSRKIGENVYFVLNKYPRYYDEPKVCEDILPMIREGDIEERVPIVPCTDVGYLPNTESEQFIIAGSVSINDGKLVDKEVILGSGNNVYASLENLYVAQSVGRYNGWLAEKITDNVEQTTVLKFSLDDGEIAFDSEGKVPGHILNQFSMDEFAGNFRIATTKGQVWNNEQKSTNNVYVLDSRMNVVGSLEDLAPGEKIYSVRFMGKKGYVVTFKKVDPLFVIDLSDASNPNVLGKLKIPGYSDYLHPYDENHIIGIGKDTVEAEDELKTGRQLDFAWYQGVKMALFDVSDVSNPIELHKVIIGDRGTDSDALHDHKAFLFDREKNLLVLPITLAEIKGEKSQDNQYGEFTFQGAYVFDLTAKDGFDLRGKVTHYDNSDAFEKSGYRFYGNANIRRSLYIGDVLYTFSDARLQMNDLGSLNRLDKIEFEKKDDYPVPILY